ncbi:MAG TPA: AsmA-like C-terminal region-containing protein [Candidatus Omnitrophota bacterium]|nr:AsmA-like C-terminal region-containing protein [Candidatus Omnitrophota bacterium]
MKKTFLTVLFASVLLIVCFFGAVYFLLRNREVQKNIVAHIERQFQNQVELGSFELSWMPPVSIVLKDVAIKGIGSGPRVSLTSPTVHISLKLWSFLLFKKIELDSIRALDSLCLVNCESSAGEAPKILIFSGSDIRLKNVAWDQKMDFVLSGNFGEASKNIHMEGQTVLHLTPDALIAKTFEAKVRLSNLDIGKLAELFPAKLPLTFRQGGLSWEGEIRYGDRTFEVKGSGGLKGLVYAVSSSSGKVSEPADFSVEAEGAWKGVPGELNISKLNLSSKYGDFSVKGVWGSKEQGRSPVDFELNSGNLNLDSLPEILVPLDKAIPTKLGFSGRMGVNCFFRGDEDAMGIAGTLDLTASNLSYAGFLTKPKEVPLKLQFNLLRKESKHLEGDFSLWLNEMSLKGTLVDLNTELGDGEVTFLTNKFSLKGWEAIFDPLRNSSLDGKGKILLNAKGSFRDFAKLSYTGTVTIEEGTIANELFPVKDLNATFEFSNIRTSSGEIDFVGKDSPIHIAYVWNLAPQQSVSLRWSSPELYPQELLIPVKAFFAYNQNRDALSAADFFSSVIQKIVPETLPLKDVSFRGDWLGSLVSFRDVSFLLYDGLVKGKGEVEFNPYEPYYNFSLEIEHLSLAPLVNQMTGQTILTGQISLLGDFESDNLGGSDFWDRFQGKGEFNVTGGAFHTFDLLGSVAALRDFKDIETYSKGGTEFNDFRAAFLVRNRKIVTDNLALTNPYFKASANGFFSVDGALNYHWTLSLSDNIFEKIFGRAQTRPVSLDVQLYGDFFTPKIGFDSEKIKAALEEGAPPSGPGTPGNAAPREQPASAPAA